MMQAERAIYRMMLDSWDAAGPSEEVTEALEAGQVVELPKLRFPLREEESALLQPGLLGGTRKNISFDPATGRCGGAAGTEAQLAALAGMLDRFGQQAEALLRSLCPRYAPMLERARASFRPAEITGRPTSPRHDDRRLHVDAFPSRPLRGRRILRVFSNVAPDGASREWQVGEPFADFASAFLPRLRRPVPGQAWLAAKLGLTHGQRSAYDTMMLGLHDAAKLDEGYQKSAPRTALSFSPGTTWMCFTDAVLHAALAGHCALEQTFHLPVEAMAAPDASPLRVLERLAGRKLV